MLFSQLHIARTITKHLVVAYSFDGYCISDSTLMDCFACSFLDCLDILDFDYYAPNLAKTGFNLCSALQITTNSYLPEGTRPSFPLPSTR
jgi:hypothetical protein